MRLCTGACVRTSVRTCLRVVLPSLVVSCRKGDQACDAAVQPGMVTYTVPGVAFGMPSSVGPLHFAPVFTSRHTAEIAWVLFCLGTGCIIVLQVLAKRAKLRPSACLVMASVTHSDVVATCLCTCVFNFACLSTYLFAGASASQPVMSMICVCVCVCTALANAATTTDPDLHAFMFAGCGS